MSALLLSEETEVRRTAPLPSVRRLPAYLRVLKDLRAQGKPAVSCTTIAAELRADPTQVRKDLAITGIIGRPKVGYETDRLIESIEEFLGWNNSTDAFLVGTGSLGSALLGFREFPSLGLNIVAAFDASPSKVGRRVHGHEIMAMDRLRSLARRMHIHIGVLTVPAEAAQKAATLMADSGILAIWNFTPARLDVPGHVIVEKADLSSSLAALTSRLRGALREAEGDATQRRK
jgi:redox-sensing transcriptional repressor